MKSKFYSYGYSVVHICSSGSNFPTLFPLFSIFHFHLYSFLPHFWLMILLFSLLFLISNFRSLFQFYSLFQFFYLFLVSSLLSFFMIVALILIIVLCCLSVLFLVSSSYYCFLFLICYRSASRSSITFCSRHIIRCSSVQTPVERFDTLSSKPNYVLWNVLKVIFFCRCSSSWSSRAKENEQYRTQDYAKHCLSERIPSTHLWDNESPWSLNRADCSASKRTISHPYTGQQTAWT